ncbi:transglutaminase-like domain-containing protein [uncultured Winogradskyella sp.]|uniref:transglutaminase-like domain-containing protein n=1 Tax=uncultured Winogradskyella sp. TaxID=395353 RepID=UPI00260910A9|nr:transglutaminase-like domain-containing protein [uncultured Winogradskyella sp.]
MYYTRFRLLSHNADTEEVNQETYNKYNQEKDIPKIYYEINKEIFKNKLPATELEKAKQIALWLRSNIKGGPGLSLPSDEALVSMLDGRGGVCSDLSQVFNNFCVINGILVKEWGITIMPFDKRYGGHAVNEIFSKEMNKWILIDVSRCILFYLEDNVEPLSTLEVFTANGNLRHSSLLGIEKEDKQLQNYFYNPSATPYLIVSYKNKLYDSYLRGLKQWFPIFVIHFLVYMTGRSYKYKFPLSDYNDLFKSA